MLSLHKKKKLLLSAMAIATIIVSVTTFSINRFMSTNNTSAITYAIPEGYTTFSDPNFYDCVASKYKSTHSDADISNGLTDEQLAGITSLTCVGFGKSDNEKISDATGLEKMTGLTYLDLSYNKLASLDVSHNTALTTLYAYQNQLTSLDVSQNTSLTELRVYDNQLTSLDVSYNTELKELYAHDNQLTSLNVSGATALTSLYTYNNQLTSLNVSGATALTSLYAHKNQLTSLDVSHNTALTTLYAYNNQLTSLDVSHNTALTTLYAYNNQLTSLDVSHNTALTTLDAGYNQLTSLNVSGATALTSLYTYNNQLTSLDVSHNTALTSLRADNILIRANIGLNANKPNIKLDLSGLGFLKSGTTHSINNTENYTYDGSNKIVTVDNPNGTEYIQISSSTSGYTYKLQIPSFLTFNMNGGVGDFDTKYCYIEFGSSECNAILPETEPTRSGYIFLGWANGTDATNALYWLGDTVSLTQSKTIYAVWIKVKNNTNEAIINTPSKNTFTITSNKACRALWTNDNGSTWNRLNSNTVAGNNNMREFNIGQLNNIEILVAYAGDTNSDNNVNVRDARKIVNTIMGKDSLSNSEEILADVDNNNSINIRDARAIVNSIMGKSEIGW